jgi:endonuclease/exonuclease/phosphatase family metal-dependent hydrolase
MFMLNIFLVISTLIAYSAPHIHPVKFSFPAYFGLAFPFLLIGNILFILFWIFVDFLKGLPSFLTLAFGFKVILSFFNFNKSEIKNDATTFSIISYNINNALKAYSNESATKKSKQKNMREFMNRFKDEDIICLQEFGPYANDIVKNNPEFKHLSIHRINNKKTAILSKHTFIDEGEIDFGTITNSCVWVDLVVNFETLRVYSVHLQSNQISKDADELVKSGDLYNKKGIPEIKGIFKKFGHNHVTRSNQVERIKDHMNKSPYSVILCGDLNDTPLSYTYGTISEGMKDLFYEKGKGIGTTYSGSIPLLRIDYIFTDHCIHALSYKTIKEDYSDHYPIASLVYKDCNANQKKP